MQSIAGERLESDCAVLRRSVPLRRREYQMYHRHSGLLSCLCQMLRRRDVIQRSSLWMRVHAVARSRKLHQSRVIPPLPLATNALPPVLDSQICDL